MKNIRVFILFFLASLLSCNNNDDNRKRLKDIMEKYAFSAIKSEWWHYDLKNYKKYPILDISFEDIL